MRASETCHRIALISQFVPAKCHGCLFTVLLPPSLPTDGEPRQPSRQEDRASKQLQHGDEGTKYYRGRLSSVEQPGRGSSRSPGRHRQPRSPLRHGDSRSTGRQSLPSSSLGQQGYNGRSLEGAKTGRSRSPKSCAHRNRSLDRRGKSRSPQREQRIGMDQEGHGRGFHGDGQRHSENLRVQHEISSGGKGRASSRGRDEQQHRGVCLQAEAHPYGSGEQDGGRKVKRRSDAGPNSLRSGSTNSSSSSSESSSSSDESLDDRPGERISVPGITLPSSIIW